MPGAKDSERHDLVSHVSQAENTKDLILLEAAMLFAQRGFSAVSVRDIANKVNIKAASIYNHFKNKDALLAAIVENIRDLYLAYYGRLGKKVAEAGSFEEVLECMFAELKEVYSIFIYYGGSLILTEQFRDPRSYEVFKDVLLKHNINYVKQIFDGCIEKNWVKPFDSGTAATILMHSVLIGTLMRTHEDMGRDTPYDVTQMFASLQKFILDSVQPPE